MAEPDGGIASVLPGFEDYPHAPWFLPEPGSVLTLGLAAALHAGGWKFDWLAWSPAQRTDWPGTQQASARISAQSSPISIDSIVVPVWANTNDVVTGWPR